MAKFCLSIAANDLVCFGLFKEELVLFGSSLLAESDEEHASVEAIGSGFADEFIGSLEFIS